MSKPPKYDMERKAFVTDDGVRHGLDMNIARIEDAVAMIRKDAPYNAAEQAAISAIGHLVLRLIETVEP